jgi:putative Holliday junction resolvase
MPTDFGLADVASRLPIYRPIMALDLGSKTIGVAISDLTRTIASPLVTINRRKFSQDIAELLEIISRERTGLVILGLPLNMDGTEGPRAQSTRAFARNLAKHVDIPIVFWDERLSTAAVERAMIEADASRARRERHVDKLAAAWILQAALDSLR